jgi:type VI secretion system protein ImpA
MSDELHTPAVVDLDAIFQPVSDELPCGENLRYSGLYDQIAEARRADDVLSQGDWQTELKVADYRKVAELAVPALKSQSKDLQVAAWLSEALIKIHGFAGLRDSLLMVTGLQDKFWDSLYPVIDEGDMEGRANAVAWLDSQGADAIKGCPFIAGKGYGYNDWLDAKTFDIPANLETLDSDSQVKFNQLKAQAETEGRVTSDIWKVAVAQTNRAFCEMTNNTVEECWAAFAELNRVIEAKYDRNQMPGLGALKKSLEEVHDQIKKLLEKKRLEEPDPADTAETEESEEGGSGEGGGVAVRSSGGGGPVKSRPEALKQLSEIAAFLQRTEPHSPVSYLVQRAVKWGNMPLGNWLQEVIKDESVLHQLRETLGLNQSSGDGGYGQSSENSPAEGPAAAASSDW